MAEAASGRAASGLITGWKQIARHFAKDERTVKRWAQSKRLPVRRTPGQGRSAVFAYVSDLNSWLTQHAAGNADTETRLTELPADGGAGSGKRWPSQAVSDLYLDGAFLWQKRTKESLARAIETFQRAGSLDPNYAPTFAGLATTYDLLVEVGGVPPEEGYELARTAANRAIMLDPGLAQAHSVLADVMFFGAHQIDEGLAKFAQAAALDLRNAQARQWYAAALLFAGRYREAQVEIDKARMLAPESRSILATKGLILLGARDLTSAETLLSRLASDEPGYRLPCFFLSFVHLAQGRHADYLARLEKWFELAGDRRGDGIVAAGKRGLAMAGPQGMTGAMIEEAARQTNGEPSDPYFRYFLAHLDALAGRWHDAVQGLGALKTRHAFYYVVDPAFAEARQNPSLRERIAMTGLPVVP